MTTPATPVSDQYAEVPGTERGLSLVQSPDEPGPTEDESGLIALRAYELWEQRRCRHDHDMEDWLEAERWIRDLRTRRLNAMRTDND
jgi:hypothetical protein